MAFSGPTLPADISGNRDVATMKIDQDRMRDVVARCLGGGPIGDYQIVAGNITPSGEESVIFVDGEGGIGSSDDLDSITADNFQAGAVILLLHNSTTKTLTVRNNATAAPNRISLNHYNEGGDTSLLVWDQDDMGLLLYASSVGWLEVTRFHGLDAASHRTELGLGDAALATEGAGNGLDADLLDGLHAAAFLPVAGKAADSTLFDGDPNTAFPRLDETAEQEFEGALEVATSVTARTVDGLAPTVRWFIGAVAAAGTRFAEHFFDSANKFLVLRTYDDDGTTIHSEFRLPSHGIAGNNDNPMYRREGGSWVKVLTPQNIIAADLPSHLRDTFIDNTPTQFDLKGDDNLVAHPDLDNLSLPAPDDGVAHVALNCLIKWEKLTNNNRELRITIHVGVLGTKSDPIISTTTISEFTPSGETGTASPGPKIVPAASDKVTIAVETDGSSSDNWRLNTGSSIHIHRYQDA